MTFVLVPGTGRGDEVDRLGAGCAWLSEAKRSAAKRLASIYMMLLRWVLFWVEDELSKLSPQCGDYSSLHDEP